MSYKYDACHAIPDYHLADACSFIYTKGKILTSCSGNVVYTHFIYHFTTNQRNKAIMP